MAADRKGESWAVLAASEMGKGVWLKQVLRREKPGRLVIWDRNDEYDTAARQVHTLAELARACKADGFKVRYVPKAKKRSQLEEEFEMFCLIAFECVGAWVIVEELADVTSASYAPPAWRQLNTRGRHHQGLTVIGLSQSPAWVDKAFLGNATFLHIGFLGTKAHRQAVADEIGCSAEDINALVQFEFIEYRKATKERTKGRVKLTR